MAATVFKSESHNFVLFSYGTKSAACADKHLALIASPCRELEHEGF